MQRRTFIAVISGGLFSAPQVANAQKPQKIARVGILGIGLAPSPEELARSVATNPFWQSMRQLGWVEGQNLIVERRFGESDGQLRAGAADLVRLKVDVLFVSGAGLAKILQSETKTIPIVVGRAEGDLVAAGLVDSLAKPVAILLGHRFSTMISRRSASSSSERLYRSFPRSHSFKTTSLSRHSPRCALGAIERQLTRPRASV